MTIFAPIVAPKSSHIAEQSCGRTRCESCPYVKDCFAWYFLLGVPDTTLYMASTRALASSCTAADYETSPMSAAMISPLSPNY